MTSNEKKLRERIVEMSQSNNFDEAKKEWFLKCIYKGESVCLCGKNPIHNICLLHNKLNNNEAIVGSSCVDKFIGMQSQRLFASFQMIDKDIQNYIDPDFADYLCEQGIIGEWEKSFLVSTFKKKFIWLTEKQASKRIQINEKVIKYMKRQEESKNGK